MCMCILYIALIHSEEQFQQQQTMGQQVSLVDNRHIVRAASSARIRQYPQAVRHEGLLRFQNVPFKSSKQIGPSLFVQKTDYNLAEIISDRAKNSVYLTQDDLVGLLESVVYTLAYLQSKSIVYKDLTPQNIFYSVKDGTFKMLPPQLIEYSSYSSMYEGSSFFFASPQMIISIRQQSKEISDQLYHKSNIFTLGMIILSAATLIPSYDCYQQGTFDILDVIIKQRVAMVREIYPRELADVVELMIKYDANERMKPTQIAMLLNRFLSKAQPYIPSSVIQAGAKQSENSLSAITQATMLQSGVTNATHGNRPSVLQHQHPHKIHSSVSPVRVRAVQRPHTPVIIQPQQIITNPNQIPTAIINYVNNNQQHRYMSPVPARPIHQSPVPLKQNHPRDVYLNDTRPARNNVQNITNATTKTKAYEPSIWAEHSFSMNPPLISDAQVDRILRETSPPPYEPLPMERHRFNTDYKYSFEPDSPVKSRHMYSDIGKFTAESSSDHSIRRIKEQIQKSRKIIQELQYGKVRPYE